MTIVYFVLLFCLSFVSAYMREERLLEIPDQNLCDQRVIHEKGPDGKGYYFSWRDPTLTSTEKDWLIARNYCRKRCMETISLETSVENDWIKEWLVKDNVKYIWTSGRKCDFPGCTRPDLQPAAINGWFWTGSLEKLSPSTNREQNDWSETGEIGKPQPDNKEGSYENCLAILNQLNNDGVHWHDVACHHLKPWVCEENIQLMRYAKYAEIIEF
ncbi:L-selectin-like isoform X2 [Rhynchophorus ferrugineus]|uniref:L-selectin-like isoform X2 n=1 Tax=Rhynchophorus ferrugineus TaxID=354439 RepID=UPI003FCE5AEB